MMTSETIQEVSAVKDDYKRWPGAFQGFALLSLCTRACCQAASAIGPRHIHPAAVARST